jgi:K+-sensing histidine kinase KdpD
MKEDADRLLYLGIGPLTALLVGALLMPLRGHTVASNFTFVFIALTIVVGELGGRASALATALVSALSLDFFLTQPYLRLSIEDKNDLVAFIGLGACGLLAAFLGSRRGETQPAQRQLGLLHDALRQVEVGGSAGARLQPVADQILESFPLAAVVVRDERGTTLSWAGSRERAFRTPSEVVAPAAFRDARSWRNEAGPLPPEGLRLPLVARAHACGWLDLCGDGRPVGREARGAIAAMASVLSALMDGERRPVQEALRSPSSILVPRS